MKPVLKIVAFWLFAMTLFYPLIGQNGLEGLWEGTITRGGIYSKEGVKMELYLRKKGKQWYGRAIIHESDSVKTEMNLLGTFYEDRSIYLRDKEFVPFEPNDPEPVFFRKYQLIFFRSIWEMTLNGYWQDDYYGPLEIKRRRGRVFLKKVKQPDKA